MEPEKALTIKKSIFEYSNLNKLNIYNYIYLIFVAVGESHIYFKFIKIKLLPKQVSNEKTHITKSNVKIYM